MKSVYSTQPTFYSVVIPAVEAQDSLWSMTNDSGYSNVHKNTIVLTLLVVCIFLTIFY